MLPLFRFASPLLVACALAVTPASSQTLNRAATAFPKASLFPTASVAFGNGTFVGLGLKGRTSVQTSASISAYTSTDGSNWTERSIAIPNVNLNAHGVVRFIGGQFIFAGRTFDGQTGQSYVARSADGISWAVTYPANLPSQNGFQDIVAGGGATVGFFGVDLASSTDNGATWTARTAPGIQANSPYRDLAYGAGRFVLLASGVPSKVWTSADAATWTEILPNQQTGGRIAFGNGIFVLTGNSYKTSTDGVNFTERFAPAGFSLTTSNALRFVGGRFLYHQLGLFGSSLAPIVMSSADGAAWAPLANYAPDLSGINVYDFAQGNDRLVSLCLETTGSTSNREYAALVTVLDTATIPPVPVAPAITAHPVAVTATSGGSATFTVTAVGTGNAYQWRKDNINVAGATAATLTLDNLSAADAGNYAVAITNPQGFALSNPAALTFASGGPAGRLINLAILTGVDSPGEIFTMGYVVSGANAASPKSVLVRAAGPSLVQFNVSNFLADPKMETYADSTKTGENDNWGGSASLSTVFNALGAFAYTGSSSLDAATISSIAGRDNSVRVSATGNGTGMVIAEVYDATPANTFTSTTPRLINVSVLKNLGSGLTAGFVIGGSTPKAVLVRAVGPTLASAPFNVPNTVSDPQLTLFSRQTVIGSNDNWGGGAALATTFAQVGAFVLPPSSRDAALVTAPLSPGDYTVQVTGVGGANGTVLVEVYEIP